MIIKQVAYEIPPSIMAGLTNGEFSTFGSVVRDRVGTIAYLKEVPLPVKNHVVDMGRIAEGLKNPKAIIAIGLGAVVVGGIEIWAAGKKKQNTKPEMPKCVENCNASLSAYLEAARNGKLDADIVNRLISDLDAVKENSDSGKIAIDFSIEQLDTLVKLVMDYTRKLAEANSVELSELQEPAPDSEDNLIIDLRRYLEAQKQIFNRAA
jgi:hypothetical protein